VIAALYVQANGCYAGLPDVDPWCEARDARRYAGPWPVIAHPPCERWGAYWNGGPAARVKRELGDDGGCFAAALAAVRKWGGVLEHPRNSRAWRAFDLAEPPFSGAWVSADFEGGWTCCVDQGAYGHRAQKATWLYAVGVDLPSLVWGRSGHRLSLEGLTPDQRRRAIRTGVCQRLSKRQRAATPIPFRDLLLGMARSVAVREAA
jgi:hypothetical protein